MRLRFSQNACDEDLKGDESLGCGTAPKAVATESNNQDTWPCWNSLEHAPMGVIHGGPKG
jgi:hypothetical protein